MNNSIKNLVNCLSESITKKKDFSIFVLELKKELDKLGVDICGAALAAADEAVKLEPNRKKEWIVEKKDSKTLLTIFGEVKYNRTYYKSKKTLEYKYISDEILDIETHDRMDTSLKAKLVEEAIITTYKKSGESAIENIDLSSQTVMNSIRELGEIPNFNKTVKRAKKQIKYLYIEADEDHVALQNGLNVMPRLVYVHEGIEPEGNRNRLKNIKYFSGIYDIGDLWLEVANYHVSHILSDRLSSRPLGWSVISVDQMSRLRAYSANGGAVYDLFLDKINMKNKEKKLCKISKKITQYVINKNYLEKLYNIEIINCGKKDWLSSLLKALRGA